jgi:tRNA threonylcarbamoyladenosine biosynthesis protein TsaB
MLLLITDTADKNGSVALARAEPPSAVELIEAAPLAGGNFAAQIVPHIADLLARHKFGKNDIGAFVVVAGPGSFTGLRVGLAAVKALAEILRKPIVPVSLLEIVAHGGQSRGKVVAALDAGRGEVYVGEYDTAGKKLSEERVLGREEFYTLARETSAVTSDDSLASAARSAGLSIQLIAVPDAATIARFGFGKLQAGEIVSPEFLEADYIRRSDAEIFAQPGAKK